MTNHWIDLKNSDVILIMGANPAENHPISFRWVMTAKDRGATVIHVDPRYTRTSTQADIYASLRSGTDIAFLGGLIKYILDNELYQAEYVAEYTNASYLVNPEYTFEAGIFSGFQPEKDGYDKGTWWYQMGEDGIQLMDSTLQDPRCVFQLLRQHYARYDLETVSNITGTPVEDLLKVYTAMASTGRPDRVATIMYAMGWTQHTHGTQNIRAATIIQSLLGNMGMAGGGINALRGESNVQGSTDHGLLFHILPGYLAAPRAKFQALADYIDANTPKCSDPLSANWWQNFNKYAVSLLKAMYGDNATADNEFGYGWLPKLADGGNYSWLTFWPGITKGVIKGLLAWGQNPAVSSTNANWVRDSMDKLEWMVTVNLWDTETSSFWQRPGVDPASIQTEVFMLPCAASVEKEGSITNSGRWAQWRYKAAEPLGDAEADGWIINQIMLRLRTLYAADPGPNPDPILQLAWNYGEGEVDPHQVAKEINGWAVQDIKDAEGKVIVAAGQQVKNFTQLQADGSTACACWIYSGSYNEDGNMMTRRDNVDTHPQELGLFSNWAWAWPLNRRIIYNRASVNMAGEPIDPKRALITWNAVDKKWEGDVPDGGWPPGERLPFIMRRGGRARLFGPTMADGPFPEHYEPWESPVMNPLHHQETNPALWDLEKDAKGTTHAFPLVGTTYRVSEHWQTGAMTRNLPWLAEMQPDMFVEMSPQLAAERGIVNGEWVIVESARGAIEAVAMVTPRFQPFTISGETVHEIGLPYHWGYTGLVTGGSANELTPPVGDANTMIPETKAFLCNVRKQGVARSETGHSGNGQGGGVT
jgi:formate dehydrogenase major subunit